jgi:RND family efflux transporter MFP subunit
MAIGVAVANAILLVTFAEGHRRAAADTEDRDHDHDHAARAAVAGARGRLRAILMTTGAMTAGMLPMALGWGEGGEQTAPLGRAVIGGLVAATAATLLVLPTVFALVQGRASRASASIDPDDPASPHYHEDEGDEALEPAGLPANGHGHEWSGTPRTAFLLGLPLALAALAGGCTSPSEGKADPSGPAAAAAVAKVEVVRPGRQTIRRSVGVPGQIVAFETTAIHAKIPGYVRAWNVNIGAQVKKGQVLAELSVPEFDAELRQKRAAVEQAIAHRAQAEAAVEVAVANVAGSEAKVAEARAGISRAEADLARWQAEYRRVEELFQARAQTGSLLDETRNKLRSAEASREEVRAQVRTAGTALVQSRAALDQARSDVNAAGSAIEVAREDARRVEALLGYTRIEAPFDGVVTRRNVDTGQLTRPGSEADPLFIVERSDVVTAVLDVPEVYAIDVDPGDRVTVALQALKDRGKAVEGTVTRTAWALDPKTRTLHVEVDLPNPGGLLRPGLYAYATVVAEEHPEVLTVPAAAVFRGEKDQAFCVVVVAGKARRRPIGVGLTDGTRTEVASGLDGGEAVVKAYAASLTDGQPVEPIEPAAPGKP